MAVTAVEDVSDTIADFASLLKEIDDAQPGERALMLLILQCLIWMSKCDRLPRGVRRVATPVELGGL